MVQEHSDFTPLAAIEAQVGLARSWHRWTPIFYTDFWTEPTTGSGTIFDFGHYYDLRTGAVNPSTAFAYTTLQNASTLNWGRLDFSKRLLWFLPINRVDNENADAIVHIQLTKAIILGDLADMGIGIIGKGYTWHFENHDGTNRTETNLGFTNIADHPFFVFIDYEPSVPRIRVYINGVLMATITTNIRVTESDGVVNLLYGIQVGASAADAEAQCPQPWFWFEE